MRHSGLLALTVGAAFGGSLVHASSWTYYQAPGGDFQVRSRASDPGICSGVSGVSGYVDSGDDHTFFWTFESRNRPETDPVILWLTGGPGASSVGFGAMTELGPCIFDGQNSTTYNPYSWNQNATVIFVDQPLSVGYSHGAQRIKTLDHGTHELYKFLTRLFEAKPEWSQQDFYVAGESFGGSYVPSIAAYIQERKHSPLAHVAAKTSNTRLSSIRLKGIMVGNGLMNQVVQRRGIYETGCLGPSPLMNETQCTLIQEGARRCELLELACQQSDFSRSVCDISDAWCQAHGFLLIMEMPIDWYNFGFNCTEEPERCAEDYNPKKLVSFLNSREMRAGLGIDKGSHFEVTDERLNYDYAASGEIGYPSHQHVTRLLDDGLRVLIYAGNLDWGCHAPGMKHFVDGLAWKHQNDFEVADFRAVHKPCDTFEDCPKEPSLWGWHKRFSLLSYMELDQAGHMAPRDQPEATLGMINYWLAGTL